MILPPLKLILGVSFFILMVLFMMWYSRRSIRPYYDSLNSLTRHFSGALDTKKAFWSGIPTFVGSYSHFQFSVLYGTPSGVAPQNRVWLYCRRLPLDQTGKTTSEELIKRQQQQLVADGWTYVSYENNELRAHRDVSRPLNPELIKTTLDNIIAAERGDFKTPSITLVDLETATLEVKAKKRKAALLHAVINVFIIVFVYTQLGGPRIFAHIIAALLIIESAGFILYTLKFKK